LVHKSSGYFIYASTVIKFVDDKNFRPLQRLDIIENLTRTSFLSPYGALDELYTQILSAVPNSSHLVSILRVIDTFEFSPGPAEIDELLGLERGDTELSLRGLHSLIFWDSDPDFDCPPSFIHASFSDFLGDKFRAGDFY
ncbi:hypothetical protein B0H13DRAFT_1531534, partial [Mycena leptocephala]